MRKGFPRVKLRKIAGLRLLPICLFPAVASAQIGPSALPAQASPYFREITAALAGAVLLAIIIMIKSWRGRVNRLVEQRDELAVAVMLRTREIRREKDIVDRQKQQIEELLIKAQQSNRAKDEFLANMSHEMRTPLHGILGVTDLLLQSEVTVDQQELLNLTSVSAKSLLSFVNDVLNYSKIEAGGLMLQHAPFSIRQCVDEAAAAFRVAAKQKGLEFQVTVSSDVPKSMDGDCFRLRQVLINLLSNALKFTERGSIRLDVAREETDGWLRFAVQDTGIGVPADKFEVIFEPFRQADSSTTRKYGGTGLGLSVCSRLASQMGGELAVESEQGRGSTFTLRLPPPAGRETTADAAIDESELHLTAQAS